jgi:hypothetical protein
MEQGTRIIQLGSPIVQSDVITFEDAFGEFSEARGKGRARRKSRKLERIANRDEVRTARAGARQTRRTTKQQGRIAKRSTAQGLRQAKRTTAAETRQARRTGRTVARQERKDLRNPEEEPLEESLDTPIDDEMIDTSDDQGQGYDQGQDSDQGSDQGYDQGQGYDSGSQGQGGQTTSGEEWGSQGPTSGGWESDSDQDYGNEDYGNEDYASDQSEDTGDYGDDSGYLSDYQSSDDFNFDGVMGAEDRYSDLSDDKSINVGSDVQDLANKIAWNQELINRLEQKRKTAQGNPQQVSKQILMRKKRLAELQKELDQYSNSSGDWCNADGKVKEARRNEVGQAIRIANRKRSRVNHGGGKMMTKRRGPINRATPVQRSLNANFYPNRIVVDGKSNATGINGLDLMGDYDAPDVREIQLGVDGSITKPVNWMSIAIGVAIGVTAIVVAKKYNLMK